MLNPINDALFTPELWNLALEKYASAVQLTVQLFDAGARPVLGPIHLTPLFELCAANGCDLGVFVQCARACIAPANRRPAVLVSRFHGLSVVGASLVLEGDIVGAAVAGYVFTEFSQASEIHWLAREAGVAFERLWAVARKQQPVPERRLVVLGELLQALGDALLRENLRTRQYQHSEIALKHSQGEIKTARDYAEATLRSSPVPLLVLESDLRIVSANEAFYEVFHVNPAQTEGQFIYDLGNKQWDIPRLRELLEGILPGHSVFRGFEVAHDFPTIGPRTMLLNARRMRKEGAEERIILVMEDITERKRIEEALRASEAWHRLLMENMKDVAIAATDPQGLVVDWNPGAEKVFGFAKSEILGRDAAIIFTPEDRAAGVPEEEMRTAERSGCANDERWHVRKDGQHLFVSGAMWPIRNEAGELQGYVKAARDVTERRQAEEFMQSEAKRLEVLVRQRTAKLQVALEELEAFSYSVAHDLRAPLRAMSAYAQELLKESALSAQGQSYLQRIDRAASRLDRLTQEVLAYSQLARAEINLQPIDLDKLVRDVVEQYPDLSAGDGCAEKIEIRSPLLPVLGHEGFLAQALANLLINACKFVEPGAVPKVVVRTEGIGEEVRIWVEDNGIGIAPEHRDRLFKMFGRIHPEKKYEGTGIGLAIVQKAAERMGGTVGYESELGKGSRFWMQLRKP